jgi:hypothetical protein
MIDIKVHLLVISIFLDMVNVRQTERIKSCHVNCLQPLFLAVYTYTVQISTLHFSKRAEFLTLLERVQFPHKVIKIWFKIE